MISTFCSGVYNPLSWRWTEDSAEDIYRYLSDISDSVSHDILGAAMAFIKDGVMNYVVYNFGTSPLTVTFSDGVTVTAAPNTFGMESR